MNFNELQLGMKSLPLAMVIDNFIIGFREYSKEIFSYREKAVPDCETYFSFIFQDDILMFIVQKQKMIFADRVKTSKSSLYTELEDIS